MDRTAWHRTGTDGAADQSFVSLCYKVLLGREPETIAVVEERVGQPTLEVVATTVRSDEFRRAVLASLVSGEPFDPYLYRAPPTYSQRFWMADRLPLFRKTADALLATTEWPDLLTLISADACFREATGLPV